MFGASLATGWTALRLRLADGDAGAQRRALRRLLRGLARSQVWRQAGVKAGMGYRDFRRVVPLQTYDTLAPAIERMRLGEKDVLWPDACDLYVASAGTANTQPKLLPVTPAMMEQFHVGCRDALLYYTARAGHAGVFHGRHLHVTGSTALRPVHGQAQANSYATEWPGIAALNLSDWSVKHLYEPGAAVADMGDWQTKVDAMIDRTLGTDITLMAGAPLWLLQFADTMRAKLAERGQRIENLQAAWPNLECCLHGGMSMAPYQQELRALLGPEVKLHEIYAAAEGVFAAQDTAGGDLRLLTSHGIFFEFIPFADFEADRLDSLGEKAVALRDVTPGVDYVVVITTPAGLARYVLGDVVRFSSVEPPRFTYAGRTDLMLDGFGERVLEREVTETLQLVCQRHRWTIVNHHVAPLFTPGLTGQGRGRHEWWVELKPGTVETPTGPQMAAELDVELQRMHAGYAERRREGRIEAPFVRLVMPGVFRHWMRFRGRWGGHHKIARCRSDRMLADELAQMTRFAGD